MVLLCSVVLASGCVTDNQNNKTKTYAQNNITFTYPGSWDIANTTSPNAVVAVADPTTVQTGTPSTLVVIQKSPVAKGSNFKNVYDTNYASFFNNTGYQQVSEGNITINGVNAFENIYKTNQTGVQKQYRAVWFNLNGNIYVILCSAVATDFEKEQTNFNMIVNSFKAQ